MARHITNLKINGYRGLCDFSVDNLADINILVGDNNCGKTSVLEVINTFSAISNPAVWLNNSMRRRPFLRGKNTYADLIYLFNINNSDRPISIEYTDSLKKNNKFSLSQSNEDVELYLKSIKKIDRRAYDKIISEILNEKYDSSSIEEEDISYKCKHLTMNFTFNDEPVVHSDFFDFSTFISTDYEPKYLFTTEFEYPYKCMREGFKLSDILENTELYEKLIEIFQEFDKDITRIYQVVENGMEEYKIASEKNNKALSVSFWGDGLKLALSIFAAIPRAQNGILLIDEFDSSLHITQIGKIMKAIITMCQKLNIQLFMTTHSLEAVDKVIESCDNQLDDMRVIRIKKKTEKTFSTVIEGNTAKKLRFNNDAELR